MITPHRRKIYKIVDKEYSNRTADLASLITSMGFRPTRSL
jgi:hypothetical protein